MSQNAIAIEGEQELIQELSHMGAGDEMKISRPTSTRSPADALDSPIGAEEVKQALEIITIVFKSGTALVGLVASIRSLLNKHEGKSLRLKNPLTGKEVARLTSDSSEAEIERALRS